MSSPSIHASKFGNDAAVNVEGATRGVVLSSAYLAYRMLTDSPKPSMYRKCALLLESSKINGFLCVPDVPGDKTVSFIALDKLSVYVPPITILRTPIRSLVSDGRR